MGVLNASVKEAEQKFEAAQARASDVADQFLKRAGDAADKVSDRAETVVAVAQEKSAAAADSVNDVTTQLQDALIKSAKTQPLTTVAIAVAAGFALGALWRSGR